MLLVPFTGHEDCTSVSVSRLAFERRAHFCKRKVGLTRGRGTGITNSATGHVARLSLAKQQGAEAMFALFARARRRLVAAVNIFHAPLQHRGNVFGQAMRDMTMLAIYL